MIFLIYKLIIILSPLFQLTTSNCNGVYCAIDVAGTYPQILPRPGGRSAVAYDASQDTIIILGGGSGSNRQQYVTFTSSTFDDKGQNYMSSDGVYGTSQYYSQLNNILWMINDNTPTFITMNTETRAINYPSITIPTDVGTRGCLATLNYNNNKYLFVIGGYNSNDGYLNLIQVYNIDTQQWSYLPTMQTYRRSASCIINNNILYVIGGKSNNALRVSSVEYFNIGNYFSNIPNQQWTYTNNNLTSVVDSCIAVNYGNNIFVIGGINDNNNLPTDINIINTNTKNINVNGSLVRGVMNPSVIIVSNIILYVFLGTDINGLSDEYQYINLYPTSNPSKSPTFNPTITPIATQFPSYIPTNTPTINPSITPSKFPTISPILPTINPSINPQQSPTISPINIPTISATLLPTYTPTTLHILVPSIFPTFSPTINNSDSASGEIEDDIKSTFIMEHKSTMKIENVNYIILIIIGAGLGICCGVIAIILHLCLSKRKQKKQRKQMDENNMNNNEEGNIDTKNIQLSTIVRSNSNFNGQTNGIVSIDSMNNDNDIETFVDTNDTIIGDMDTAGFMEVVSDIDTSNENTSNENINDDDIDIHDLVNNNNTVTAGFMSINTPTGNNDQYNVSFDEQIIENDNDIDIDDMDVVTPRFKNIANDAFIVDGEESQEGNGNTIQ